MKFKIILSICFFSISFLVIAQTNQNSAYAITGDGPNNFNWINFRQVNLSTGQIENSIFDYNKNTFVLTNAITNVSSNEASNNSKNSQGIQPALSVIAAVAFDKKNNRLYFTSMFGNELRWINLDAKNKTTRIFTLPNTALQLANTNDEANNITRMVIAKDGNGYAVTNDGNHLFRFTTGERPVVTDLGNLVDAEQNNGISVHNKCSSWGGDMLADAFGKLYIISAGKNVFVVDIDSRIASYKGTISGLPANYSTNAAAVDADGNIVLSSANVFEGYYKCSLADLAAKKIENSDNKYSVSDLASSNLLLQKEADAANKFNILPSTTINTTLSNKIFPNPVTGNTFNLVLDGYKAGNYKILVTDMAGRPLQTNQLSVAKGQQFQSIVLAGRLSPGSYFVKIFNAMQQQVYTEKLIVL